MRDYPYVTFALPQTVEWFDQTTLRHAASLTMDQVTVPRELARKVEYMIYEGGDDLRQRIEKLVADTAVMRSKNR